MKVPRCHCVTLRIASAVRTDSESSGRIALLGGTLPHLAETYRQVGSEGSTYAEPTSVCTNSWLIAAVAGWSAGCCMCARIWASNRRKSGRKVPTPPSLKVTHHEISPGKQALDSRAGFVPAAARAERNVKLLSSSMHVDRRPVSSAGRHLVDAVTAANNLQFVSAEMALGDGYLLR